MFEYTGPGVATLSVPERTTITNMGTELGATSSIFPTDDRTREYLARQGREGEYVELSADADAEYADELVIDLSALEPLIALPSMPDDVVPVREVVGTPVQQVIVGSCTNGGYEDILPVAKMLKGREVDRRTDVVIAPGSKQASELLAREGWTAELMAAGVNFSEATCGACIGIGHVPASDSVSLRTFNRNFEGRSGIEDDAVYLCSPEVAAAAALTGEITDPGDLEGISPPGVELPKAYDGSTVDIITPEDPVDEQLIKGPNIGSAPIGEPIEPDVGGEVLLKMGDNITTDHIIPGTAEVLMYRSNIEKLSEFTLSRVDDSFAERAMTAGGGVLVAGENYGQGSSREHAAMCPLYLGVEAVVAQSFARIHKANLINFGIIPLEIDAETYDQIEQGESLRVDDDAREAVLGGATSVTIAGEGWEATAELDISAREREILAAGGKLRLTRDQFDTGAGGAAPADD